MPSAMGWKPGAANASKLWASASIPVAAVSAGGSVRVNSGSAMMMPGIIPGWKMIFLVAVSSQSSTTARPVSDPVPAVVGTATTGARPSALARVQLSPTSSKSQAGRSWAIMKATALPASSPLPPPKAMTPS